MAGMKDMEMPAAAGAEQEEDFDFGFEGEEGAEESADLAAISDDDLIAEMKKRGFEVEDEPEEDMGEEVGPESDIMGEEPIV